MRKVAAVDLVRRALVVACAAMLASLAAGCAAPQTDALLEGSSDLPRRAAVADVPFIPQEKYQCGPASLAMLLSWSGTPVAQDDLVSEVYTPARQGTLRTDVLAAARRRGRLAVPVTGLEALLAELAAGNPVLVFQNLALDLFPQWHYAVAIGYDLDRRQIVLHSGTRARRVTDLHAFERTWARGDRWALVVVPPDHLPATADEREVLKAGAALERVGRPREAARAYRAILKRWPESFAAHMGLGNALYEEKSYAGAARAFRAASRQRPEDPAPWNNLAYVLAAEGRREEARRAAETAVRLAPGDSAPYRDTLEEITESSRQALRRPRT